MGAVHWSKGEAVHWSKVGGGAVGAVHWSKGGGGGQYTGGDVHWSLKRGGQYTGQMRRGESIAQKRWVRGAVHWSNVCCCCFCCFCCCCCFVVVVVVVFCFCFVFLGWGQSTGQKGRGVVGAEDDSHSLWQPQQLQTKPPLRVGTTLLPTTTKMVFIIIGMLCVYPASERFSLTSLWSSSSSLMWS